MATPAQHDQPGAPTILQDRSMATTVSQLSLCPKMDLLAVVLDRNTIAIFRTNWQRLATIPIPADDVAVSCLAWSPDGANIIVGTTRSLAIYSVDRAASAPTSRAKRGTKEASEPIAYRDVSPSATAVTWSPCFSKSTRARRREGVPEEYLDRAAMVGVDTLDDFGPSGAGLLFVGDRDGVLTIMTYNLQFTIARTKLIPPGFYVERLHLTPNLRYCLAVGYSNATLENEGKPSDTTDGRVTIRSIDLDALLEYWPEIDRLGKEIMSLHYSLQELEKVKSCVIENWTKGAMHLLSSSISSPLAKLVTDFAEERESHGPWDALHDVFCGARMCGAMLQFLAAELSENGAKEALRGFRSHVDNVDEALMSILPMCENNVFRASEYRGLARLASRFGAIGVHLGLADKLYDIVEALFLELGEFACEVEKTSNEAEAFLAWLVLASARAGGETIQGRGALALSNLEGRDALLVSRFFQTMCTHGASEKSTGLSDTTSEKFVRRVVPLLEDYRKVLEVLTAKTSASISASLFAKNGISLPVLSSRASLQQKCSIRDLSNEPSDDSVALVCAVDATGHIFTVRHNFSRGEWGMCRQSLEMDGLFVFDACTSGNSEFLLITSERNSGDPGRERAVYSLSVATHETGLESDELLPETDEHGVVAVQAPVTQHFAASNVRTVNCGQMEKRSGIALSVNSNLALASVLLAPRRIVIFDLSNQRQQQP